MATGSSEVASPNTRLGEKDLAELHRVLYPAKIKYKSFGLQIGVGVGEIACIERMYQDPGDCLLEILTVRVRKSEPLTWNDIVAALREECVGLGKIADDIRQKYAHLFTPTISMASEYEHGKQFDKVIRKADSEEDEKETCRQRHERVSEQDSDEEVGGREKRTQSLKNKHKIKSKNILKPKEYASIKKKSPGGDHRARVSKEGERSSEYEGIETVRSMKHVESEDEALSRKKKELSKKEKRKGGKPAHDKEKQVHDKERPKVMNKEDIFMKDESHSEPETVEGKSTETSKITYHKTRSKPLRGETEYQGERENSSEKKEKSEKSEKRKGKATRLINFVLRRKPNSQDDEKSRRVKGKKLSKASGTPPKEDSHGDKEESDAGGSRDQDVVSGKKGTAPPLERDLPSSEMAETDSGDGESDESSEDKNESEQKFSVEEEETENDDGSSVEEKEEKLSENSQKSKQKASTLTTTTEMQKTKSQDDDDNSKQKKSSKALSKDDSYGDKEGSDPGGSRDQEDQPKKRNRRRHRERSKTPIVRGGSSPSSSQEERKPGSRRQRRTHKHGGKYKRKGKKKRRETSSSSSDTGSSSPESEMLKNLTKSEKKKLKKVFKHSFGQLCSASFNPVETAVQLQKKGLISSGMMIDIIRSPESQQDKIIRLVCGLDNRIRSRPERLFGCIEVLLENDALQEVGREMLRETGKPFAHQAQGIFVMCISSSLQV